MLIYSNIIEPQNTKCIEMPHTEGVSFASSWRPPMTTSSNGPHRLFYGWAHLRRTALRNFNLFLVIAVFLDGLWIYDGLSFDQDLKIDEQK
jgi:hypothetical protein